MQSDKAKMVMVDELQAFFVERTMGTWREARFRKRRTCAAGVSFSAAATRGLLTISASERMK